MLPRLLGADIPRPPKAQEKTFLALFLSLVTKRCPNFTGESSWGQDYHLGVKQEAKHIKEDTRNHNNTNRIHLVVCGVFFFLVLSLCVQKKEQPKGVIVLH